MDVLNRAVSALRDDVAGMPEISAAGRTRIAAACYEDLREPLDSFRPGTRPRAWLSIAAFAPIVILGVAVLSIGPDREPAESSAMFVAAAKTGSEVVFQVADGRGPHTVLKSTDPSRFNPAAATVVENGRYADRADSGPVIVFYRID